MQHSVDATAASLARIMLVFPHWPAQEEATRLIPQKYTAYVFSFLMALIMSGIMSMVITLFNIGPVDGIVAIWLKAWMLAFVVAFPIITLVVPVVRYLVSFVVRVEKDV